MPWSGQIPKGTFIPSYRPTHAAAVDYPRIAAQGRRTSRWPFLLVVLLMALGLVFPTSLGGQLSRVLEFSSFSIACLIFGLLMVQRNGVLHPLSLVLSISIPMLLLLFTLLSPFEEFSYGALVPFLSVSMLLCVSFRYVDFNFTQYIDRAWLVLNLAILTGVLLLATDQMFFFQFIIDNYAGGYEGLVPNLLSVGRPVLVFISHSTASFFYFALFFLNLRTFMICRKLIGLIFAVLYLVACWMMQSVSGYILTILAIAYLIYSLGSSKYRIWLLAVFLLCASFGFYFEPFQMFEQANRVMAATFKQQENGFNARYTNRGVLAPTISYITEHPFSPIGLGYSSDLWYADSGPLYLILRGSLPLLLVTYTAFWLFLKWNLRSRLDAYRVFTMLMAFEFGMINLLYFRTIALLPFFVVYLNSLDARNRLKV